MNREELKALGLSDEQIESVMKSHGKATNDLKTKADSVEGLESQITDYQDQLKDRDTQLEDLKKVDAEGLQQTITDLQDANKTQKTEYEEKLETQQKDFAVINFLKEQKVKDPDLLKVKLDLETVTFKDGKLGGLDEQLTPLKESHDYLFESEVKPNTPTIVAPGNPQGGATTTKDIAEMSYQELADLKSNNPAEYAELTK